MRRFTFTLFCIAATIGFLVLGNWQLQRHEWKTRLITAYEQTHALGPANLSELIEQDKVEPYRDVTMQGHYLEAFTFYIEGKYHGRQLGKWMITPFQLTDGPIVLVLKGWVSDALVEGEVPHEMPDSTTVEGIIRPGRSETPMLLNLQNEPEKDIWRWEDVPTMASVIGTRTGRSTLPILVHRYTDTAPAESKQATPLPYGKTWLNDHLQYAYTWFALALITLIMYGFWLISQRKQP